jgi:hypothetical protein
MKKVLMLSLVLGIASLANAALDLSTINGLSYEVSGNTVTISSTLGVTGYTMALVTDDKSTLSNGNVPAGFSNLNNDGFWDSWGWDGVFASVGTAAPVTGTIFSIDFTPSARIIYFHDSAANYSASCIAFGGLAYNLSDGSYFMTVPEPTTLLLLGLGSLMLRKRRK